MILNRFIQSIVNQLADIPNTDDVYNPYGYEDANQQIRRENLGRYLQTMYDSHTQLLMVMEAPGYRGCRLTGIPVTSRKVMLEGASTLGLLGQEQGYQDSADLGFEQIYGEQSATIVWETCANLNIKPILWNAFPLHPHQIGNLQSNRKPRQTEIDLGIVFLSQVLDLFNPQQVIAVGNVADGALNTLHTAHTKIRHPAQGGKHDFVAGLSSKFLG